MRCKSEERTNERVWHAHFHKPMARKGMPYPPLAVKATESMSENDICARCQMTVPDSCDAMKVISVWLRRVCTRK